MIITETLDPAAAQWLEKRADVIWCPHENTTGLHRELADADGLVVRTYTIVNDALLDQSPRLRVVGRAGAGLDNIDLPACRHRGVQVVYTPDANTQAVVEYVSALMLDALRPRYSLPGDHPCSADEFHQLRRMCIGAQLDELTLGVLGFGRIGRRVAQVAHTIGMKLLVNDLLPEAQLRSAADIPFEFVDQPRILRESDVLTIHVDGRPENRGLIGAAELARLKPNCLLINTARGMLIDSRALADWAQRVAATGGQAVLDVHDPEPPPPHYPLWSLPNVRLLPHLASRTSRAMANMSRVVEDVITVLQGRPPRYPAW